MNSRKLNTSTQCVHAGTPHNPHGGGVNSPILTSSAYHFLDDNENIYPRYFNTANQNAVVEKLCVLEKGEAGLVLSSGMAAISTALVALLKPGDHVVLQDQIYGGTYHFAKSELEKLGVTYTLVEETSIDGFRKAIGPQTKLLYFETPSNPLLKIVDVAGLAQLARTHNVISMIDNTFASPINQNPIELGVDVVMHSGTKYLGGHSDLCFGALITSKKLHDLMLSTAVNWGASMDALSCYQVERSLKTLALRVERQNQNALKVAQALHDHAMIETVYYPGLETHPDHELARSQMHGFGGMLSFELKKGGDAVAFCKRLQLIRPALSLGGVETLISIPCLSSHIKMSPEDRLAAGISDDLLRLSVGIEDAEDIIADITQAVETGIRGTIEQ